MPATDATYYDRDEIWEGYATSAYERERTLATAGMIPADAACVVDLGCGNGLLTNAIRRPRVVGIDFARTPLKQVRRNPVQASITAIPLKAGRADVVVAAEVLEHLDDATLAGAVAEIRRLEPRHILISVPFDQCLEEGLCRCAACGRTFHVAHHLRSFDDGAVERLFDGYVAVRKAYLGRSTVPIPLVSRARHRAGVYCYSDTTICPGCGGRPRKNNPVVAGLISAVVVPYDSVLRKRVLGIYRPTHQVVLLKKR